MVKRAPIQFQVELTGYGWSVRVGAAQLGLFTTQRQALDEVRRRRTVMNAEGKTSTVSISGAERDVPSRLQPFRRR